MPFPTELFTRHQDNPVLTAADWPRPVSAVFNPGACRIDGHTALVCRVEDTMGISHLWVARSPNGLDSWTIDDEPLLSPRPGLEFEEWGLEDARVVRVDELDGWVITCTAYGPSGPAVYLAVTDLHEVERRNVIMSPEDKNAALLPRRINGDWVLLHRPVTVHSGPRAEIWLSRSRDLESWRRPERVLELRKGAWWDSVRVGIGPPPIETPHGWLLIYHGVRDTVAGSIYRVGLALLDLDDPTRVRRRSSDWVMSPTTPYERIGDVPNVVFPCGVTFEGRTLRLYYGAADTSICIATADLDTVVDYVLTCDDPST